MKYHTILFDLDGTLTDSGEGILNCVRYAIERLGGEELPEETLRKFVGPPLTDSFMEFCGFTQEQAETALELYRERYTPIGIYENKPADGALELLKRLKAAGVRTALASSKPEGMCRTVCDLFGFTPYLDVIAGAPLHGQHTKTDVIRDALKRLELTGGEGVLMVGDRKYDAYGAAEAGMDCIGVRLFGYAAPGELEESTMLAVLYSMNQVGDYILGG